MNYNTEESIRNYIEKILAILDIEAAIYEEEMDETTKCYRIDCKPADAKLLIGRQGQTMESLQFLLRQMGRRAGLEDTYFLVDVANYRQRRTEAIMSQGKVAAVAVLNGEAEEVELLPMTPFERRLVHKYLQENFPELASYSRGNGPDRRVCVCYQGEQQEEPEQQQELEQSEPVEQESQPPQEEQGEK